MGNVRITASYSPATSTRARSRHTLVNQRCAVVNPEQHLPERTASASTHSKSIHPDFPTPDVLGIPSPTIPCKLLQLSVFPQYRIDPCPVDLIECLAFPFPPLSWALLRAFSRAQRTTAILLPRRVPPGSGSP